LLRFHKINSRSFFSLCEDFEIVLKGLVFHRELLDDIHQLTLIGFKILNIIHILLRIITVFHISQFLGKILSPTFDIIVIQLKQHWVLVLLIMILKIASQLISYLSYPIWVEYLLQSWMFQRSFNIRQRIKWHKLCCLSQFCPFRFQELCKVLDALFIKRFPNTLRLFLLFNMWMNGIYCKPNLAVELDL